MSGNSRKLPLPTSFFSPTNKKGRKSSQILSEIKSDGSLLKTWLASNTRERGGGEKKKRINCDTQKERKTDEESLLFVHHESEYVQGPRKPGDIGGEINIVG